MSRAIAVLGMTVAMLAGYAVPAEAVFPGGNGKVAFTKAGLGGQDDIWTVNPDGTGAVNLTQSSGWTEAAPAWSPDREKIAYIRSFGVAQPPELFIVNADGSDQTQLLRACDQPNRPAWSPDGTQLAVSCRDGGEPADIWITNLDGSSWTNLTDDVFASPPVDSQPAWSPDGTQIAWVRDGDVWKMSSTGAGKGVVVDNPFAGGAFDVTWSPDGTQLAFTGRRDCINCFRSDIYKVQTDGSGLTRLTDTPDNPIEITWAPDGTKLLFDAFTYDENQNPTQQGLYTINIDGTGIAPFGGSAGTDARSPDWQVAGPPFVNLPEPGQIAFVSDRDHIGQSPGPNDDEIYTMNPDGTRQLRLTFNTREDTDPAWSRDGQKIAFVRSTTPDPDDSRIFTMNANGTNQTQLTSLLGRAPSWSPDGSQLVYAGANGLWIVNADGTGEHAILSVPSTDFAVTPDWSPVGERIVFRGSFGDSDGIWAIDADGTDLTQLTSTSFSVDLDPTWSPSGARIAFTRNGPPRNIWVMDADGSNQAQLTFLGPTAGTANQPAWAHDGSQVYFTGLGTRPPCCPRTDIVRTGGVSGGRTRLTDHPADDANPHQQPAFGYPRPKGATPARFSLVTAYRPCTAPDRDHGPPLAFGSCSGPQMTSDYLTVGTADANGLPPRNEGYVRFDSLVGQPSTPADEADVRIEMFSDDVFTKALADYAGELRLSFSVRVTDRGSPAGGQSGNAGTVSEIPLDASFTCTPVPDPQKGSSCAGSTTIDALIPGAVTESRRSIWQLNQVRVFDGGADGDGDTVADNTLFATAGLFVP